VLVHFRSSVSPPAPRTATTPAASGTPGGNLGTGYGPPADRRGPPRLTSDRRLRGRTALPPAQSLVEKVVAVSGTRSMPRTSSEDCFSLS